MCSPTFPFPLGLNPCKFSCLGSSSDLKWVLSMLCFDYIILQGLVYNYINLITRKKKCHSPYYVYWCPTHWALAANDLELILRTPQLNLCFPHSLWPILHIKRGFSKTGSSPFTSPVISNDSNSPRNFLQKNHWHVVSNLNLSLPRLV